MPRSHPGGSRLPPKARQKLSLPVSGVWIRTRTKKITAKDSANLGRFMKHLEVLVEVNGVFRQVWSDRLDIITEGETSHIVEPLGIADAPEDDLL